MLDILSDYLRENAPPELRDVLEDAHAAFDRIGLSNYEQGFESILMTDDESDQGSTLVNITELTRKMMNNLLRQHEIVAIEDASLEMMVVFLNGIMDIQDYDNHHEVIQTCSLDINPQECLAELLSLVTAKTVEDLLANLDSVSPIIITRIKQLAQEATVPPVSEEEQAVQRAYIEKLKRLMSFAHHLKLDIVDHVRDGLDVGFPFLTYMGLFGREFEEMPMEKAAYELMAMALISSDGTNNPHAVIKEHLENYISDPNKLTKLDIKLREISLGLQR